MFQFLIAFHRLCTLPPPLSYPYPSSQAIVAGVVIVVVVDFDDGDDADVVVVVVIRTDRYCV